MEKLETKIGFLQKIKDAYERFDHYLYDLTGHIMDGKPMHNHKLTSKNNHIEHGYFYY